MNSIIRIDKNISSYIHDNDSKVLNYLLIPFSMMCRIPLHYVFGLRF